VPLPKVLADLVFAESLFQRVGAATGKERDENAVVAGGWCSRSATDERKFLVGWCSRNRLPRYASYPCFYALKVSIASLKTTHCLTGGQCTLAVRRYCSPWITVLLIILVPPLYIGLVKNSPRLQPPPTDTGSLCLAVDSTRTAVGLFPVAGPTVWNSLPDELRDPACDVDSFKQFFKTILFSFY